MHFIKLNHNITGVVGGGVKAFGPSRSRFALAFASVNPLLTSVVYLLQSSSMDTLWTSNSNSFFKSSNPSSFPARKENKKIWYTKSHEIFLERIYVMTIYFCQKGVKTS